MPKLSTLPNGLELITHTDPTHPLVSVQLWVRVGSIHEEAWTGAGLAHLTEHMLFKGTSTRSAQQLSQSIQALGGYVNAYTSFNRTVYWIDGLSGNAEGYIEILADMAMRSKLDADELTREKDVIRREMAMDNDDPSSAAQHLMQASVFRVHPLRHPIIGHRAVFDQVPHQGLVDFVKRHYSPNNCFLVVTGDVDHSAIHALAEKHFGSWERQPFAPVMLPAEPPQHGARIQEASMACEHTRVMQSWPIPGDAHADMAALNVLAFLLGSGRSARLYQELREKRGIAHTVWSGAWTTTECGIFGVDAECDASDTIETIQAMNDVIRKLQSTGPSNAELAKAVRSTIAWQARSQATTRGMANVLGNGWLTLHSLEAPDIYLKRIKALTPAKIREVAVRYLVASTLNRVVMHPEGTASKVTAKKGRAAVKRDAVSKVVLRNGLTVLMQRNARLPLVSVRASFMGGVPAETEKNAGLTQVTSQMLMKGTTKRTAAQLATQLEERGGHLYVNGDAHRLVAAAEVMAGDETLAVDIIADVLMHAKLPQDQLASVQKRQIASIREELEDPLTIAMRRARKELFTGTPYHRTALGTETSVKSLKRADCQQWLKAHLTGGNGVVSVVGDFDPKAMQKQLEATLGKLPKGQRLFADLRDLPNQSKPEQIHLKMPKEQAVLTIGYRTVGLHSPDSYVLSMIGEACSDMGSRLFNRIREELGLAYYVGAQSFMAVGAGAFYFYLGTDPQKLELAQKEMLKIIADLAKNGLQASELDRAKTTWKASWLRQQQGNGPVADSLTWDELNGQGHEHRSRLTTIIDAITAQDVKRVAKQYLSAKPMIVRVSPE